MMNTTVNPYQHFNEKEMEEFYAKKQNLHCMDATMLLDKCIYSSNEKRHYKGTYQISHDEHYIATIVGPLSVSQKFREEYSSEMEVLISTSLLLNKLDATMYYWRELNPELVHLLTAQKLVKLEVISNWVKMIHYLAPINQQCSQ